MIASGRITRCPGCGKSVQEGCVRPAWCSHECRERKRKEREEFRKESDLRISQIEYKICPNWSI